MRKTFFRRNTEDADEGENGVKQMFFSSGDRLFLEYFLFDGGFRRDADIRILNPLHELA